jgi:Alw26I/Eco31I/Esp3I family type II restriction endonuclease
MSNAPDRFDGYHTYNLCCRSVQDTGRHKSNLNRYGEDRRVYENWSDGDWKAASWLMKIFNRHGLSPDHIGPLSLGFAHRPKFNPLTRAQNSAKNNRMSFSDIKLLLDDEKKGEIVVSGHSKYIWDKLKSSIKNDQDALKLSKLMRLHLHQILTILSEIHKRGYKAFLVRYFLHPEYANYSIEFLGFDPSNGSYKEMIKKIGTKKQYSNNAKRYIRKSFDVLKKYRIVKKRNTKIITSSEIKSSMEAFFQLLKAGKEKEARKKLDLVFSIIGDKLTKNFR